MLYVRLSVVGCVLTLLFFLQVVQSTRFTTSRCAPPLGDPPHVWGLALCRIVHFFLRPDGPSSSTVRICWSIVCRLCGSILIAFLSPTAVPVGKCRHNRYLLHFLNSKTSSMKIVTYVDICISYWRPSPMASSIVTVMSPTDPRNDECFSSVCLLFIS